MNIFNGFEKLEEIPNPVLTIGTFDGVHVGHQKIIEQLNKEAEKIGGESVLFTFYPHPRMVLYPENHGLKLIQTQVEKVDKLRRTGLKNLIIHPFSKEFSRLSAIEFVRDYLVNRLHVKKLIIGYDHQFGKNREGSISFLKEICETYGFEVIEIKAQEIDEVNISSTKIRKAIENGNMELANSYLGEPFEFFGKVIEGQALGRELGYPTANIDIESDIKLIPKSGVYASNVLLPDGTIKEAMMNIGVRPSIDIATNDTCIEVHLLDFEGDLYGQHVTVQLLKRFRSEQKFDSLFELKEQLQQDEKNIRAYFLLQSSLSFCQDYTIQNVKIYDWEIAKMQTLIPFMGFLSKKLKMVSIPNELKRFTQLRVLNLSKNRLTKLPPFFSQFKHLEDLDLEKNKLIHFPIVVYQLTQLKHLRLGRNLFERVPTGIDNLEKLVYLDLYDTPIRSLPESLTHLKSIQKIDFTGIRFSPSFQKMWTAKMPNIELIFDAPCDCLE